LGIDIGNGGTLYITGLRGNFSFKTGQKISKGDVLGIIGKCYHSIPDFCIDISVSRFGKSSDPMSPFGIKSSFVPPSKPVPVTELTVKQAKEDFGILTEALKEGYAGLYDCVTPEQFDSHFYIYPTRWLTQPRKYPGIWAGWVDDTLRCTRISSPKDSNLYMKQIVRINGMSADSCKTGMRNLLYAYDSKVQDYSNRVLFTNGCQALVYLLNGNFGMDVEFADGAKRNFPEIPTYSYVQNWTSSARVNYNNGLDYKGKIINDSTAYLGISTFELSQVELEGVRSFIDSISKADVPHLIIDVRDNDGGSEHVLRKIFSYIASDTLHLDGYNKVNRKGGFETFKYSENYTADMDDIFPEYQAVEGKDGFYDYSNETVYSPDSLVHYRGKVYVLTNDNSISAATLLPALVIRSHRGVTVGRETRSAYHFLNAMNFSQLHLPNSQIVISIPLVESVFDTVVNERVPFGRGAIPDYEVPITMDELEYKNGDAILNKALSLIAEGKYFTGPDPFAKANANHGRHIGTEGLTAIIAAALALAASLALILTRKKKADKVICLPLRHSAGTADTFSFDYALLRLADDSHTSGSSIRRGVHQHHRRNGLSDFVRPFHGDGNAGERSERDLQVRSAVTDGSHIGGLPQGRIPECEIGIQGRTSGCSRLHHRCGAGQCASGIHSRDKHGDNAARNGCIAFHRQ